MSMLKRNVSSSYYKRKTLDNIQKARERYNLKHKTMTNKTNYSTVSLEKNLLKNKFFKLNSNNSVLFRNKFKSQTSIKKGSNPPIKLKLFSSRNNFLDNNNNIYVNYRDITINKSSNDKNKLHDKDKIIDEEEKINSKNDKDIVNDIRTFNKRFTFKTLKNSIKKYKYKMELKKEEEKDDKVCLLKNNFNVKNFILSPNQVINYLDLNDKNNFFVPAMPKNKNNKNINRNNNFLKRNRSAYIETRLDKIKKIYPTVLNIEGQKNRKILYELNHEDNKNKKNEKPKRAYNRHNCYLKRRLQKEKYKAEQCARINLSDLAYKSQLLILSMKIYQRAIHQLQKKNSFKFNLDLPLYNLFLNLD